MKKLLQDKRFAFSIVIIFVYVLIAVLCKFAWIASPWDFEFGAAHQRPRMDFGVFPLLMGTDLLGRSVLYKMLHGTLIAMSVGFMTCLIAVPIGSILGALSGFLGGWIDDCLVWLYTTISNIPSILLILALAYLLGKGLTSVYLALGLTSWISLARLIRGEFLKHREREYVLAARSLGVSTQKQIFRHIFPNVMHVVFIQTSLLFQMAIKTEVILSYLGLGVQGLPSWGIMIDDSKGELVQGYWWQLSAATAAMFLIILAFNLLGDALRDHFDPKIK